MEISANQKEAEARIAMADSSQYPYYSDSDDDDDDEPAMFEIGRVRRFYTRDAAPDEKPLLPEEERAQVRPKNWENTKVDFFVEEEDQRMYRASNARKKEVRFARGWDKYDDYENSRQLYFKPHSRVDEEFPEGGERIIREGVLSWHRDMTDEKGKATASRRVWPSLISSSVYRAEAKNRKLPLIVRIGAAVGLSVTHRNRPA